MEEVGVEVRRAGEDREREGDRVKMIRNGESVG